MQSCIPLISMKCMARTNVLAGHLLKQDWLWLRLSIDYILLITLRSSFKVPIKNSLLFLTAAAADFMLTLKTRLQKGHQDRDGQFLSERQSTLERFPIVTPDWFNGNAFPIRNRLNRSRGAGSGNGSEAHITAELTQWWTGTVVNALTINSHL